VSDVMTKSRPNWGDARKTPALSTESGFRTILLTALAVILPIALLRLYYGLMFPGLTNADALDFAQIGRSLVEGRGFSTSVIRPLTLPMGTDLLHLPDTTHGPLYPFCLALGFGIFGVKDSTVALVSGTFFLLTIPLVYLLGCRVGNKTVGRLAAIVFTANALNLEYAVSGLHISLYIFLTTALFLILHRLATFAYDREKPRNAPLPKGAFFLSGLLTGLLYLADPVFFWVIPVAFFVVAILPTPKRGVGITLFLVPLLLTAGTWMLRNGMVANNPFFGSRGSEVWMNTPIYPGNAAYRMLPEEFVPGVTLLNAVVRKMFLNASQILLMFPQINASWMLAFFLPSLLFRFPDAASNLIRNSLLIAFLALFFGMMVFGLQMPLFASVVPSMLAFAAAYMIHLLHESKPDRHAMVMLTSLVAFLIACPLLTDLLVAERTPPIRSIETAKWLGQTADRRDAVFSDQPWIVAWYANRPAVWLPATDKKTDDIRAKYPQIRWLFLTEQSRTYSEGWRYVYDALYRWSSAAAQAKQKNLPLPVGMTIAGTGLPLLQALEGFSAVPPVQSYPAAVLAKAEGR
jgi:4-amino-4-deoxy-L-arabinose transferase-like glycosyltransferase